MPTGKPDNLEDLKKNLLKIKQDIETNRKAYASKNKVKADGMGEDDGEDCCPPKDDYLYYFVNYLYNYISSVEEGLWRYIDRHAEGHLPAIRGAEKMTEALKALGIDKDYDVMKPTIWVSASKRGSSFTVK